MKKFITLGPLRYKNFRKVIWAETATKNQYVDTVQDLNAEAWCSIEEEGDITPQWPAWAAVSWALEYRKCLPWLYKEKEWPGTRVSDPHWFNAVLKNMKILDFFLFLWVIFALLDPDPDPATQINVDPCGSGSGSETLPGTVKVRRNRDGRE
jgi:hypothetical protein